MLDAAFAAEVPELEATVAELDAKLTDLLAPRDPHDADDVVLEVEVDGVAPVVGGGDLGDGSVHSPRLDVLWPHAHDAAVRCRLGRLAPADVDVMGPPIHPVDDQVMPVLEFVGQPARHHAPDDGVRSWVSGVEDRVITGAAGDGLPGHFAV